MISRSLLAGIALAAAFVLPVVAQVMSAVPPIPAHIRAAVDDPARPQADRARDPGRKPAEVFTIAGLKVGDQVIEIGSFGQYDSNIIIRAIGPTGRLYMYDLPYQEARQANPSKAFVEAHRNAEYRVGKFDDLIYPTAVDMVVIDMYYHDLGLQEIDQARFNTLMFHALKPGGRVLIVDHEAEPGSGRRDTKAIHRIGAEVIPAEMQAAGFKLVINHALFDNPKDDHSKMVFAPGERGATDRVLMVFEKPR